MSKSYSEILTTMQETFSTLTGMQADDASDIGIRMKVLAGEVYSCYGYLDWIKRQMFAQTATGEQLDLHANQRGLARKAAAPAYGSHTFSMEEALWYDVDIPVGTVCAVSGQHALRYETT